MIHVVAKAIVQIEMQDEYKKVASQLVEMTRKEKGCISYGLYQEKDDPTVMTFLEIWEDMESLEAHFKTDHFTRLVPKLGKLRDSSEVNIYHPLSD